MPKNIKKEIRIDGVINGEPVSLTIANLIQRTGMTEHRVRQMFYDGLPHQEIIDRCFSSDFYKALQAEQNRMRLANKFLFGRR